MLNVNKQNITIGECKMVLRTEDREYSCYEALDSSVVGYEEINKSLNFARKYALENLTLSQNQVPEVKVCVYDDEEGINAFVTKQKDVYYICISKETFIELKRWFDMWLSYEDTYEAINLTSRNKEKVFNIMYHYALAFLVAHECFHILCGHCDIPNNVGEFLFEQSRDRKEDTVLFEQALEICADCGAMAMCAVRMMHDDTEQDVWEEKCKILSFAAYSIFKKFSEYEEYDFDNYLEESLYQYDHPYAGIRFQFVMTMLKNAIKLMKGVDLKDNIVNEYMVFERKILNTQNMKELFTIIAFTEKGAGNISELIEECNNLEDELKDYSYIPAMKWLNVNNPPVFVDNEGELIKCIEKTLNTENA